MINTLRFDFVHHDFVLATQDPVACPKTDKRGKTCLTISQLYEQLQKNCLSLEEAHTLKEFTSELSSHVEACIKRRYGFFAFLIIFFNKHLGFGALSTLESLKCAFYQKEQTQKEVLIHEVAKKILERSEDVPQILARIVLVDPVYSSGIQNVDDCYKKIAAFLSPDKAIKMAWHMVLHPQKFKAYTKKDSDIPCTTHKDLTTGDYFIHLNGQQLLAETKVKKVRRALYCNPLQKNASFVAQATTQDDQAERLCSLTLREYSVAQSFQGKIGIWPVLHVAEHIKHKSGKDIPKVSFFAPLADGTFSEIAPILPFDELLHATYTLLEGLCEVHANGYVHLDIKGSNALISFREDAPNAVGHIDFGLAGKKTEKIAKKILDSGFYGTIKYTAPELFGLQGFCADFSKTDMWAFGLMLYRAYFCRDPKWFEYNIIPEKREHIPQNKRELYTRAIKTEIEEPLAKLFAKPQPSPCEQFEMIIYKLMLTDPLRRLSAADALKELDQL